MMRSFLSPRRNPNISSQPPAQRPCQSIDKPPPPAALAEFLQRDAFAVGDLRSDDARQNASQILRANHGEELVVDPETAGIEIARTDHDPGVIYDHDLAVKHVG